MTFPSSNPASSPKLPFPREFLRSCPKNPRECCRRCGCGKTAGRAPARGPRKNGEPREPSEPRGLGADLGRRRRESNLRGKNRYCSGTAGNSAPQFGLDERGREGGKRGRGKVSPFPLLEAGDGLIRGVPRQIETVQNRGDFVGRSEQNLPDFWIGKRGNALAVEIRAAHVAHYMKPPEHNYGFCTCRRGTVLRPRGVATRTVETGKPNRPPAAQRPPRGSPTSIS